MEKHKRTEITIETRSVTTIRTSSRAHLVDCGQCGASVATFSAINASLVFSLDLGELHRALLTGGVHTATGTNLCGRSLATYLKKDVRYIED